MMLRLYISFIVYLISPSLLAQDTLTVTTGSILYIGPAGVLTLNNTSLNNNGNIATAPGTATIRFTGNVTSHILGNNLPLLDIVAVQKTGATKLVLQRNINIRTAILFNSGLLDLNGNNILLVTNATLNGESESSHIMGTSGYVEGSMVLNAPVLQNPGNLGAAISADQPLGLVIVRRGHQSQINASGNGNSILRYYDITSANNTGLNAGLRFHYLDAELNGFSENNLVLWKSTDNTHWTNEGFTSRDIGANYIEKTGITGFSRWTFSSPNNALPVVFTIFNTHCENGKVSVTWKTAQESNSSHFVIERSQDGVNWAAIGTIPAAGNSNMERTYQYFDNSPISGALYRIAQHDLDGNRKYSVIVRSSCNEKESIKLWPNPANSYVWLSITTNTASPVLVKLFDSKGRLMHMQRATVSIGNNQVFIPLHRMQNGVYQVVAHFMNGTVRTFQLLVKK